MKKLIASNSFSLEYATREALNRLRVNIGFCGKEYKKIIITSSTPNEGKSFISTNLAKMLAEAGSKVVFVDADLRKSVLRRSLGLSVEGSDTAEHKGIVQFLAGHAELDEAVYSTETENLYMMPVFKTVENPALLLQSPRFGKMLDVLAETFDYVILDTPPLGAVADGDLIANKCDGALLVVRAGVTPRNMISASLKQIERSGCTLLGTVLNRVDLSGKGYYYKKYKYGYGYYSEYYSNAEKSKKKK